MRFLILTQYFPPEIGGAQTRLKSFATELCRAGHDVEIVTALPNYPKGRFFPGYEKCFYRREVQDGLTIQRVWLYPAVGGSVKRLLNYLSFTLTCLVGLWRAERPDYIFVESPPLFLSVPAFVAGLFWGVPFIFNVADLWPDVIVDGGFMKDGFIIRILQFIEQWSYRRAAYVSTVTDWLVDVLRDKKRVPESKLLFLPNGVDTQRFRPRAADESLKARLDLTGKQIVLWAGTLGYAHGLENVLEAAKLLERESEIHFLFVGDGSAKADLVRMRDRLGLSNVTFHEPVSIHQIPAYYSIAYCGLASLIDIPVYEGARPSKIFPVLASAIPLLFVGRGEGADLVRQAQAGLVIDQGDPQALADAVLRLARDKDLAKRLGQNGCQFVEENLQWSLLVDRWLGKLRSAPPKVSAQSSASLSS
jgi:glycosyltransferase involved in cell wall biosynthesis